MVWSTESRHSRGYGAEWDRIRKRVIERDMGLCQPCKEQGRVTAYRAVDHIVSKAKAERMGWRPEQVDDLRNLQCICNACHDEKTARENGRAYRPRVQIGVDGWPVE